MAGMFDDLFEDLVKESKTDEEKADDEKKSEGDGSARAEEEKDTEGDEKAQGSPLFPTGSAWEEFKNGRRNGA